jgi:integrase
LRRQKLEKNATNWDDAHDALKNIVLLEHAKKHGLQPEKKKIGFHEFSKIYLADYIMVTRKKWETEKYRLERLDHFFHEADLREITPLMVEKFRDSRLKAGNAKSTANRYLALLKKMFTLAMGEGYLEENVVKKVKFFSEKDTLKQRVLSEEEEERIMAFSVGHLKSILVVALNTGMRTGEIFGLQWNQVDLNGRKIRVEKTKSGKYRYIDINTPLLNELLELKSKNSNYPYVIVNPDTGKPYTTVRKAFLTACQRAEIKDLRLHDLRHTFATRLINAGVDVETVRDLLGHYSVTLTQRYTHSNNILKRNAVEILAQKSQKNPEKEAILLHRRYTEENNHLSQEEKKPLNALFNWN